jgi:hypothetical protein
MIELNSQLIIDLLIEGENQSLREITETFGYPGYYFNIEVGNFKDDSELKEFVNSWINQHQFTVIDTNNEDEFYIFKYDDKYYKCTISGECCGFEEYPHEVKPVRKGIYLVYE